MLVAGCGTGAELLESRAQRPDWQLTAMDPSAEMLAVAKGRVEEIAAIEWRQAKLEDLGATERFDGALAILVLQSLPDNGAKLNFLATLARSLRPGGQLFLVDLMGPEWSPCKVRCRQPGRVFSGRVPCSNPRKRSPPSARAYIPSVGPDLLPWRMPRASVIPPRFSGPLILRDSCCSGGGDPETTRENGQGSF